MVFPRPDEDKVLLNICWGYLAKLITREQFIELIDKIPHSFKKIAKIKPSEEILSGGKYYKG